MSMKEELQAAYPTVYGALRSVSMGPGWKGLALELADELIKQARKERVGPPSVFELREKYAEMRIEIDGETPAMRDIVHSFENRSQTVCEQCASPGQVWEDGGWLRTRCVDCIDPKRAEARNAAQEAADAPDDEEDGDPDTDGPVL